MHTTIINISVVWSFASSSIASVTKCWSCLEPLNFANDGLSDEILFTFVALLEIEFGGELFDFGKIVFLFDCKTIFERREFLLLLSFGDWVLLIKSVVEFFFPHYYLKKCHTSLLRHVISLVEAVNIL